LLFEGQLVELLFGLEFELLDASLDLLNGLLDLVELLV